MLKGAMIERVPAHPSAGLDAEAPPARVGRRRLGDLLGRLLTPAARRRGFAEASVLSAWPQIVGPELAARARPVRIAFGRDRRHGGVLHLHVAGSAALDIQHRVPQILERINGYFGFVAIARLKLLQAPLPPLPAPARPTPPLDPADRIRVELAVHEIGEPGLRAALKDLGLAVLRARHAGADDRRSPSTRSDPRAPGSPNSR